METDEQEDRVKSMLLKLYSKGCVAAEKNGNPRAVIQICRLAVQDFPLENRFLYRSVTCSVCCKSIPVSQIDHRCEYKKKKSRELRGNTGAL
jgi:two-component SAPR family response regulator